MIDGGNIGDRDSDDDKTRLWDISSHEADGNDQEVESFADSDPIQ